ncbi:hypothetical protein MASR1M107_13570 [Ignavibacteriales bacterium]
MGELQFQYILGRIMLMKLAKVDKLSILTGCSAISDKEIRIKVKLVQKLSQQMQTPKLNKHLELTPIIKNHKSGFLLPVKFVERGVTKV